MTKVPTLTPEELDAVFEVIIERRARWTETASQAGYRLLHGEIVRLAGELPAEQVQEILQAVSCELDRQLTADPEYGRQMRRFLWTDDEQGYTRFMHAMYEARVPLLVEWALATLSVPLLVDEPEKRPRWVQ